MKFIIVLFILAEICLVSCKVQKENAQMRTEGSSKITLVDKDSHGGFLQYRDMVVRDSKSLAKFYVKVNKTRKPRLPVPDIDFTKDLAIIICTGEQKGQVELEVSRSKETANEVVVEVKGIEPTTSKTERSSAISYPFYLYKMPHTTKTVRLKNVGIR